MFNGRMNLIGNKKGQGSAMSSDLPAIIMIVISVAFFISSLAYAIIIFEDGKSDLLVKRAAVEAATAFIKESAKIDPDDFGSEASFWRQRLEGMQQNYGVNIYAELITMEGDPFLSAAACGLDAGSLCTPDADGDRPDHCKSGVDAPEGSSLVMVKSFPIAVKKTDLCVFPGIIRVKIWR